MGHSTDVIVTHLVTWQQSPCRHRLQYLQYLSFYLLHHWRIQGAPPECAPQQDPILSFLHMILPKSSHVGGWCPSNSSAPRQWEILDPSLCTNGGSVVEIVSLCSINSEELIDNFDYVGTVNGPTSISRLGFLKM